MRRSLPSCASARRSSAATFASCCWSAHLITSAMISSGCPVLAGLTSAAWHSRPRVSTSCVSAPVDSFNQSRIVPIMKSEFQVSINYGSCC
jgi:hypothetical protein